VDDPESQINAKLVKRIAQGDQRAFAILYQRIAPALYGMAFSLMRDAREAEDVLQEGFTYIWLKASTFDPALSNVFAWAVLIVRHKAIDKLRARRRAERLRDRVSREVGTAASIDERSAHEPALRELSARVRSALDQISLDQRQALELAFFSGMTHEEVADHLRIPLGTAKARIRRGLIQLRQLLYEER
jgi:RNA polymerase sigma-70 factor, ECF subfamily